MSTPNQLSDTPRTDAAWAKTFIDDDDQCRAGNAATDMRDACAKIERELAAERDKAERYRLASLKLEAELATERARLDYLGKCDGAFDHIRWGDYRHYWGKGFGSLREIVDAAMKEDAK